MLYLLYETSVGLALFKMKEFDEVASNLPQIQAAVQSREKFAKMVQLQVMLTSYPGHQPVPRSHCRSRNSLRTDEESDSSFP